MLADARQHGFDRVGVERARTCDALERHVVHIAAGHLGHLLHAFVGAGGGQQKDQVHAVGAQLGGKFHAFFGRVVHDQHAVHTRCRGVADEAVSAVLLVVALHRVGVTHQHHGGRAVGLAELAHHGQHLDGANAQRQGFVTGLLDHRAIG